MTSNTALSCDHSGCDFVVLSEAGMANHKCQKHTQPWAGTVPPLQPDFPPTRPAQPPEILQHEIGVKLT